METEPNEGWKVSSGEIKIRLGCGALAGFVIGGLIIFRWVNGNLWLTAPLAIAAAWATAVAAAKYGDRFWRKVGEILWWQWPTPPSS